jgi:guanine nucleotide-binding protein subunit alpha
MLSKTNADVDTDEAFSDLEVRDAMKTLWEDKGVQVAVSRGHEFALHDNLH